MQAVSPKTANPQTAKVDSIFMSFVTAVLPSDTPSAPVLILLHGYGSHEGDLAGLAPHLDGDFEVICPRGSHALAFGGFAWFELEWGPEGVTGIDEEQAREAVVLLTEWIEEVRRTRPGRTILLGGFSQGAMLSLAVASHRPELADGLVLLSGRLHTPDWYGNKPLPPTLVHHGKLDQVISAPLGREFHAYIASMCDDVHHREFVMAHEISGESFADLNQWLSRWQG